MLMIDKVREHADEFDILHFHIDLFHFPLFRSLAARTLTTLHGRQDLGDLKPFYYRFGEMPLVSISDDQRKPLPRTPPKIRSGGDPYLQGVPCAAASPAAVALPLRIHSNPTAIIAPTIGPAI